ncbi:MAG: SGNH/GDSL hydrolase family protein, partial [Bacteriovoracaceae bacterium]
MTKLKSFLLGTVFALLLLECALRVFGSLQTLPQNSRTGGLPRIITLGNSHTFGSGTTRDLSYPAQLEKLLYENGFLESIVINPARPNETTSSILDELPDLIQKYHPEYAFVMAGEPNRWNLTGYGEYLRRKGLEASREKKWGEILDHVRVVKLVKLLFNETPVSLAGKNVNESEKLFLWLPLLLVDIAQPIPIPPERLNEAIGDWEKNLSKNLNDEKEAFLAWLWSQQRNQKETLKHVDRSLREGKFYYLSWFALKKIPER